MEEFDKVIERRGTGSTKWDNLTMRVSNPNALPMWVADSDFACAQPIVDAIVKRAAHPIYGYAYVPPEFAQVTASWLSRRHDWQIDPDWVLFSPGVVPALSLAVQTFTEPGDEVIIQRPVYHPFSNVVRENGRNVSSNQLIWRDGRYEVDFVDLERRAKSPKAKLMLLCSPHNPCGRVFTEQELARMVEICIENHVLIVSDEIHADIVYKGHVHTVVAGLNPLWGRHVITCHAPSKTFNIAGLEASAVIVPDKALRDRMRRALETAHINVPNAFAMAGYLAAYSQCDEYLNKQLEYLEANVEYVDRVLREKMPKIHLVEPEATYLLWLDCRELGLSAAEITEFFVEEAAIAINPGDLFGPEGAGFVRINIACPRAIVEQAMRQLKEAYDKREMRRNQE